MRISRVIGTIVAAIVLAVVCNMALTFAMEPYGSKSEVMWTDFAATEEFDTAYVGTSLTARGFNPEVLDEELGGKSYNMGTPGQYMEEMLVGIKTAYEQKHIKRVVMGFEFTLLHDEDPKPASTYLRFRSIAVPWWQNLPVRFANSVYLDNYKTTGSINWLFPWITNHVDLNVTAVKNNIQMRMSDMDVHEAAMANERGWIYFGSGYGNYKNSLNYDGYDSERMEPTFIYDPEALEFDENRVKALKAIISYCQEKGIDLVVIGIPVTQANIMNYGVDAYFNQMAGARAIFEEAGVDFYDFNIVRPELLELDPKYFYDFEHFNIRGGEAFSKACAKLLKMRDAGEDTSGLFYSQEEYTETLDYLSSLTTLAEYKDGGVTLTAQALCGPQVQVEYQFLIKQGKKWTVVQDYSDVNICAYRPEKSGKATLRVNLREKGSQKEYELQRDTEVNFLPY